VKLWFQHPKWTMQKKIKWKLFFQKLNFKFFKRN
jgi:hypothetical protein